MAANSLSRGISSVGRRFVDRVPESSLRQLISGAGVGVGVGVGRKFVHTSVYDKNVDDQLRPTIVPDDLIEPQSDKYWAPNPRTGVFGPDTGEAGVAGESKYNAKAADGTETVLEQQAWFRPLEDIEKPQQP